MKRPTPLWRSTAALGVAGLVLAGCGGGDEQAAQPSPTPAKAKGDGQLVVGTLLPQTGSLAFLGPPEIAGVGLGVQDINKAGGVLGKPIKKFDSDSGDTTTDIASQSVDRLLSQNVDAIIGAASSSVSLTVIDKITGAGVVQFSPANTSPKLSDYEDKGLYFRTAPPDILQGRVLGDLILADGNATVGILALQDAYGEGLADAVSKSVQDGGGEVVATEIYDPKAASFSAEVGKMKASGADAIALISFEEAKKIVPEMVKQGIDMSKVYFVDGNLSDYSKVFPPGTLVNAKGTQPGVVPDNSFRKRMLTVDPKLKDYNYGPEAYDATVLTALAAEAARDDSGQSIASKLVDVSKAGEKCTTFADCKALLDQGKDIDYDGVSGPVEFADNGDPSKATIGIYQYQQDNTYKFLEGQQGEL